MQPARLQPEEAAICHKYNANSFKYTVFPDTYHFVLMLVQRGCLSGTCSPGAADCPWRPLSGESPTGTASCHTCQSVSPDPSSACPFWPVAALAVALPPAEPLAAGLLPADVPTAVPADICKQGSCVVSTCWLQGCCASVGVNSAVMPAI